MQVPSEVGIAQELQVAVQAVLQQTPWAQKPELQAAFDAHAEPIDRRPQLVPLQLFGAAQSALEVAVVQLVLHTLAVVLHA